MSNADQTSFGPGRGCTLTDKENALDVAGASGNIDKITRIAKE